MKEGKVKKKPVLPTHAMNAYMEIGGVSPRILNLGTRWRCVQTREPAELPPGGKSPVPIGWAPDPVWTFWRREK